MIAVALGTVVLGGVAFELFWLAAALAVLWEWQRLIGTTGGIGRLTVGALALGVATGLASRGDLGSAVLVVVAGAALAAALGGAGLRVMAAGGALYAGALVLAVVTLRASEPGGLEVILWLFAVVWGTDIFAYFGGRLVGGPKLWPRLSPKKTWAGFLIGIGAGAMLGVAVAWGQPGHGALLVVGLVAGALAQGGDLFESSLKRHYGVKDASHLIPGHGGVMDRLDGFLVAAVFACGLGVARAGIASAGWGLLTW